MYGVTLLRTTNALFYGDLSVILIAVAHRRIPAGRRKIRLIEGNEKCRHIKKWLVRDFAADIYLPDAPLTHTEYIHIPIPVLIHRGRGVNRGEGQQGRVQITKGGRKYQLNGLLYTQEIVSKTLLNCGKCR